MADGTGGVIIKPETVEEVAGLKEKKEEKKEEERKEKKDTHKFYLPKEEKSRKGEKKEEKKRTPINFTSQKKRKAGKERIKGAGKMKNRTFINLPSKFD